MSPESIVTSLEWSEKLKEAGYGWKTHFFWFEVKVPPHPNLPHSDYHRWKVLTKEQEPPFKFVEQKFAAPTAEEILRRLPKVLKHKEDPTQFLAIQPASVGWRVIYHDVDGESFDYEEQAENTLANAVAAMYCFLAENKLLPA